VRRRRSAALGARERQIMGVLSADER